MWVAEKFIAVASGEREVEDVAEDYLNNLVARNLIQVASRRFDGRIKSCRTHDILHNLSVSLAKETNFFHSISGKKKHSDIGSTSSRGRRIAYYRSSLHEPGHVVLNLGASDSSELSVETHSFLSSVPDEIGKLHLLSYLRLRGYYHGSLWTMKKLKFFLLHESATFTLSRPSKNEVSLPSLRILDVVNCRHLEPHWLRLKGSYPPTGKLNLCRYENLLKLHLGIVIEKLPDVEEFPPNLTKLTLRSTELEDDPLNTLQRLPKLEILKLGYRSYTAREIVCSGADSFPQLQVLKLQQLYDLEYQHAEDEAMPKLKTIIIKDCWKLKVSKRLLSRSTIER